MAEQIKVAVLEEKLQNFEAVVTKLDSAIEKIAEVNNNVSRMLAVHEERISKQEQIDSVLFDKIDKLRDKMDSDHDNVTQRLSLLERKLWIGLGAVGAIIAISNPQAIKIIKPLFLISMSNDWFIFNSKGEGISIKSLEKLSLPKISSPILDVTSLDKSIAILTKEQILVLNVR